jgi:hypothetical protein
LPVPTPLPVPGALDPSHAAREREEQQDHPLVLRLPVGTRLADAERKLILLTLEAVRGNKQRAARVLGISRRGLYSKLQAYGEHVAGAAAEVANDDAASEPEQGDVVDVDCVDTGDEPTVDEAPIGTSDHPPPNDLPSD